VIGGLPASDPARGLGPSRRPKGSWALGTRMSQGPSSSIPVAFFPRPSRSISFGDVIQRQRGYQRIGFSEIKYYYAKVEITFIGSQQALF